jgi:peptidoglycan/LPS O-acetylase OafA/YrhL
MPTRYRTDIDGLRALAVMAVILFHTFPQVLPGGFVGVDIFFVISGYLITQIILGDLSKGSFSAASFYARRIRRIFPALIVVLIASFTLGWHSLPPAELTSLGKNIVASALFSANLMLLSEVGYFDVDAHLKPLLHLWSLGIEEQFYLVWPWLLWAVPRSWLTPAILLAITASFALDVSMVEHHPSEVFYLPFTRAWELLAGGLLARFPQRTASGKEWTAVVGIVAIEASFFFLDAHTVFPGWAATVPVAGTMLLLRSEGSFVNRWALANRWAVNVGLISYPLYLWHWPLLVFAEIFKLKLLTALEKGLVVAVTFLLAWLTYRLIERPIRFGRTSFTGSLCAGMGALAIVALVPALGYGPSLPDSIVRLITLPDAGESMRSHACMLTDGDTNDFASTCVDRKRPLIAVWGDSTAAALIPGLRKLQQTADFGVAQFTVTSCAPLLVRSSSMSGPCLERNQRIVGLIAASSADVVLLHAYWDAGYTPEDLRPTIDALRARNVRHIVILGPVPVWRGGLPTVVSTYYRRTGAVIPERTWQYVESAAGDAKMRAIASSLGVDYISARDVLCDVSGCVTRLGDSLAARDAVHLTPACSEFLLSAIEPELWGWLASGR